MLHLFNVHQTWDLARSDRYQQTADRVQVLRDVYLPLAVSGRIAFAGISELVSPTLISDDACEIATVLGGRRFFGRMASFGPEAGTLWAVVSQLCEAGYDLTENLLDSFESGQAIVQA